ncbi:MAG: flagellar biosynthetic protein FliO [Gammaproteobacteria bacterium]|nr:flagellar biosynthetic protein FliO [Pseudomonadales bacterium]MCP5349045.1 flagellar biosynthetic protein FliO [Pseudomonadales bacterium]
MNGQQLRTLAQAQAQARAIPVWKTVRRALGMAIIVIASPGNPLQAAEANGQPVRPDALVGAESMVQMLVALVVVVAIIVGLSLLVRRLSLVPGTSGGVIRIVGSLALNSKDRLLLVQVGEEQILISASPGRIGKVHDLRSPVDPGHTGPAAKNPTGSFNSLLGQMLQKQR